MILKQSTTYLRYFLMVLSSDHITGGTGLSITLTVSKAGGAFGAGGGAITEIANGWYTYAVSTANTGTLGDLAFHATAATADPTDWVDQVQAHIFPDLTLDPVTGSLAITSAVKKNAAHNGYMWVMTDSTNHQPKTGLTVTAQRALDGGAFAACANSPTEITNGVYALNLASTDLNANNVMLLFQATGADPVYQMIVTQP